CVDLVCLPVCTACNPATGQCEPLQCVFSETCCPIASGTVEVPVCVDLFRALQHCGACGNACGPGQISFNGRCCGKDGRKCRGDADCCSACDLESSLCLSPCGGPCPDDQACTPDGRCVDVQCCAGVFVSSSCGRAFGGRDPCCTSTQVAHGCCS